MLEIQAIYWQTKKTMYIRVYQGCQQEPHPIYFFNLTCNVVEIGYIWSILPNSSTWHILFAKLKPLSRKYKIVLLTPPNGYICQKSQIKRQLIIKKFIEKLFRWWKKFTDFMYAFPYAILIPIFRLQVQAIAYSSYMMIIFGCKPLFVSFMSLLP